MTRLEIEEVAEKIRNADEWYDEILDLLVALAHEADVPLRDEEGNQREIYYICCDIQKALVIDLGE